MPFDAPSDLVPAEGHGDPGPVAVDELTDAEQAGVEAAVDDLNELVARTGVELATGVHDLVVGRFFGGDYAAYADRNPLKPRTFRAFMAHGRLATSSAVIRELVRVGEQIRHLRTEVALGLTVTHHRMLLPLEAPLRDDLADQAVRGRWTVEQLKQAIARAQGEPETRDARRTRPIALDAVRVARHELKRLDPERLRRDWDRMTAAQQRRTAEGLTGLVAQLQALLAALPVDPE